MANDILFVGNAKENEWGFSVELNITQLKEYLEAAEVQQAMKTFESKRGIQTCLLLHVTKMPLDKANKFRTHDVSINTKYRQQR